MKIVQFDSRIWFSQSGTDLETILLQARFHDATGYFAGYYGRKAVDFVIQI